MKRNLLSVFTLGLITMLFSATASAQAERRTIRAASSLYVISAKAGGVNFVEGKVAIVRKNAGSGYLLKGDELEIGDKVSTGVDGKAEILLNPGSFVRLGENSSFEFTTTSLEDLQLKLNSGSAMFEVITDDEFIFAVNTPKAKFNIVRSGIYRVDVLRDGTGKIEVWKGKAQAGEAEIKGGRAATANGNQVAVVKFDRDDKDALEIWSKSRAKELAKVNARLQNTVARNSLMNSFYRTRWSLYDSYGLWVYSPAFGGYCFLPFGYGWSSPYGYYYPRDIWYYNLPPVIYNPPPPTTTLPTLTSAGGTRSPRIRNSQSNREGEQLRITPPFQRVQKDIGQFPSEDQQISSPSFPSRIPSGTTTTTTTTTTTPVLLPPGVPTKKGGN